MRVDGAGLGVGVCSFPGEPHAPSSARPPPARDLVPQREYTLHAASWHRRAHDSFIQTYGIKLIMTTCAAGRVQVGCQAAPSAMSLFNPLELEYNPTGSSFGSEGGRKGQGGRGKGGVGRV